MSRRGLLGAMMGIAVAPQPVNVVRSGVIGAGPIPSAEVAVRAPSPVDRAKRKQLSALLDAAYTSRSRMSEVLEMNGGMPPGVITNKSWSPWFKAQVTRNWKAQHMPPMNVVERMLYTSVFGKEPDDE